MITIKTNHGDISVELFEDKAPISCENFRQYVKDGHFDGTVFHRVIPNFMIQGGGMDEDMQSKPTRDPIKNEADNGESNRRGTLAMARTGVGYAVFGKVSDGMDVVDAIAAVPTGNRAGHQDVPVDPVTIIEVTAED